MLELKCCVLLLMLFCGGSAYKSGAPARICADMLPRHHVQAQNSESPFYVEFEPNDVRPGAKTKVKLVAPEGRLFKGFLSQVRRDDNSETIGSFMKGGSGDEWQTLDCMEKSKSGITHINSREKRQIDVEWIAPKDFTGSAIVWATFVENGRTFWVNVTSKDKIQVSGTPVEAVDFAPKPFQSVYEDCHVTKGCFGGPAGCVTTRDCKHLVTYVAGNTTIDFEMIGETRGWIAVGFSLDHLMGSDAVTACALNGSNDRVSIYQSWNLPEMKNNEALEKLEEDLSNMESSYKEGFVYCKFTLQAKRSIFDENQFDLINNSYFLFLGRGYMESITKPVRMQRHIQNPYVSKMQVKLTDISEIGMASDLLIKLHGSLMIAAWVGSVSVAIFLARYFKQTWPTAQHCGQKIWFTWHRFLNIATLLLTVAAFVLIFIELQGWSQVWRKNPHPILGVVTTALVIIQPIMAAFRCHPGTSKRPIFNWLHFFVGNSAHILAVITLFFAKTLNKAKLPDFYMWILIAFVAFHVTVFFIVEAYSCFHCNKVGDGNQIALKDMSSTNGNAFGLKEYSKDVDSRFRKFMLLIYVFGNISFVIALVVTVTLSPVKER